MAWALLFDGVNDYAEITTDISLGSDFDLEVKFKVYSGAGSTSVVLSTQADGAQWIGRWSTTRHLAFWNGGINFVEGFLVDTDYTYRLVRVGSSVDWYINGVLELTFTNGATLTIPSFGKLGGGSNNMLGQIEYMTIAGESNYSATDSSHAAGTPVLTDLISGNNATGVNMPTDGSAWVDLGGSGISLTATLGTIEYSSNDSVVSLAGSVDVTATLGAISYSSSDATINLTGSVDVIATLGTINYASNDSVIQVSGAVNLNTTLGAINYTSNNADISLFGNVDIVATLGTINYNSNDTGISLTGGINVVATLGVIDYASNDSVITLQGQIPVTATLGTITYDSYSVAVQVGAGQFIGTVTAGFANNIYSAGFKPSAITVNFKS